MPDKKLFTPGPLTTTMSVKKAMLRDFGSRDKDFIAIVDSIRKRLLQLAEVKKGPYESVLMQGSGTFALEAVLNSGISEEGNLLVLVNGSYGKRVAEMAKRMKIHCHILEFDETTQVEPEALKKYLDQAKVSFDLVCVVHCETTSGILNPIEQIAELLKKYSARLMVDAMSSFGGVPLSLNNSGIDVLVSSANKCIQGVPGFAFALVEKSYLESMQGQSNSLSLDLYDQWLVMEDNGQFRFTPPTHAILAFYQALKELEIEGGVNARAQRYANNHKVVIEGMNKLGFVTLLEKQDARSYIISSFAYPDEAWFNFSEFYQRLSERGQVIYPGKLTKCNSFRIGNIGDLNETDMQYLMKCIKDVITQMKAKN